VEQGVLVIVSPSAGGGRAARRLPAVEAALARLGVRYRTGPTTSLQHGRELAREAVGRGEAVFTLSGDGLAGAVAGELAGTDGVLGVLPGGRGNDFARKLGVPGDAAEAVVSLIGGRERRVDIGEVEGRAFLGIASCGLDSDVQVIANRAKLVRGGPVYAYSTLRALAAWRPARFEVVIDGTPHEWTGYAVAAANSGIFGGGMRLAPDASLDDGVLEVVVSGAGSKLRYLRNLPRVFRGTHLRAPNVHVLPARELRISADRPFDLYADGDPIAPLPATIRVRPGALRVRAPA